MSFSANAFCIWMSSLWKMSSQISIHLYLVTSTISHSLLPSTTVSPYFIFIDFCSYHLFLRPLLSGHSRYNICPVWNTWAVTGWIPVKLCTVHRNTAYICLTSGDPLTFLFSSNRCFPCAWFNSLRVLWFCLTVQRHTCYINLLTDDFKMAQVNLSLCVSSVTDRWFLMGELPSIYWLTGLNEYPASTLPPSIHLFTFFQWRMLEAYLTCLRVKGKVGRYIHIHMYINVFGAWDQAKALAVNLCRHRENIQTPHRKTPANRQI